MDFHRAVELICEVTYLVATIGDEEVLFTGWRSDFGSKAVPITEIEAAIKDLELYETNEETHILRETVAEFLVDFSRFSPPWGRGGLEVNDEVDGYQYRLGKPSIAFALFIADKISELGINLGRRGLAVRSIMSKRMVSGDDENILDIFIDLLRINSLRIESAKKISENTFQELADSFYFHVGFNLDYPVVPKPTLQESVRRHRIQRLRLDDVKDLDAPHKKYIPDLVHNYQLGLSTDSPMLSYLSYYHVAEHWFTEVFHNDIALKLQGIITSPGFSYRRMKDLRRLIKIVSDELKTRDDEVVINELSALKLTLIRYVDLSVLADSLDAFDSSLVPYYASAPVEFSGGNAIDLRDTADEKLFGKLAQRIYKNRNALVHRKNGAKSRFAPFRDDHALDPEVPMMRFIAEQIIISSATV